MIIQSTNVTSWEISEPNGDLFQLAMLIWDCQRVFGATQWVPSGNLTELWKLVRLSIIYQPTYHWPSNSDAHPSSSVGRQVNIWEVSILSELIFLNDSPTIFPIFIVRFWSCHWDTIKYNKVIVGLTINYINIRWFVQWLFQVYSFQIWIVCWRSFFSGSSYGTSNAPHAGHGSFWRSRAENDRHFRWVNSTSNCWACYTDQL